MVATERALATTSRPVDDFQLLDVYAGGVSEEPSRVEPIATISAGYFEMRPRKDGKPGEVKVPVASRDGTIYLHDRMGRAAGLAKALAATNGKRLTIAFPHDDPRGFVQQRFMEYTASELKAYGDETAIAVITDEGHRIFEAGTDGYKDAVKRCKVHVSVYFTLAEWTDSGPMMIFPDGFGFYRLRFNSRNSLRSIVGSLRTLAPFTRDRFAGVPFELMLDYRETSDPKGAKRLIPVFTIVAKGRDGRISSRDFREIMQSSLREGAALMLPAPAVETLESALDDDVEPDLDRPIARFIDDDVADITEEALDLLQSGGRCDAGYWNDRWHAVAQGTPYEDADARHAFIAEHTGGQFDSLKAFLAHATESTALALISALELATQDAATGELPMSDEELAAAEAELEAEPETPDTPPEDDEPAPASDLTAQLFGDAPVEEEAPIPPALVKRAEMERETFRNQLPTGKRATVDKAIARFHYDRLTEITGSVPAASAVLQYLTGTRGKLFTQLTFGEAGALDNRIKRAGVAEALAAIVPVAKAWVAEQAVPA